MSGYRAAKSGLNRDVSIKLQRKYDADLAGQCLEWIEDMINTSAGPDDEEVEININGDQKNFGDVLHDGVLLARLTNALMPGTIPRSKFAKPPKLDFKKMELIEIFINKAKEFGVPDEEMFATVDLYEQQNLHQVVVSIQSVGRKAKAKGMLGFGPKEASKNPRKFSQDQLKAGEAVIGLQMGTNRGASQAGMNFGKTRMIMD